MSSLDFFPFDMEDAEDINELFEQHHHHHHHHHGLRPSSASTSARDLLSRMQLAQAMQHQQQEQRPRHHHHLHRPVASPAGPLPSLASNNLVDGLMNDDWNVAGGGGGGELFEFEDGMMDDAAMDDAAAAVMGGDVGSPDHVVGAPAPPMPPPSSSLPPVPTVDDIVAAYWHGRATGAMASAGAAAAGARSAVAAAAAPPHHHRHRHRHHPYGPASGERAMPAVYPSLAGVGRPSATALTANLSTASALATTDALNAQLFQHWLHGGDADGGVAHGGGAAAAAVGAPSSWEHPAESTSSMDAFVAYPPLPAFSSPSPLGAVTSPAAASSSSTASHYLAQLLASGHQDPVAAASSTAATAAASLRNRLRDANTASSLLESRLELARANAYANAQHRAAAASAAAAANDDAGSSSALLSSLLDFEDASLPGDDDSIGTVDAPCGSDDGDEPDDLRALEDIADGEDGGGTAESPSCAPPPSHPAADDASISPPDSGSTDANDDDAAAGGGEESAPALAAATTTSAPSAPPPRRSRRQAAVRGLERISTALATHGMGGGESDDEGVPPSSGAHKKEATKAGGKGASTRRKAPTIIPKPSNKSLEKEKEQPKPTCCICLEEPTHEELAEINGCTHPFCFTCIEKWADQENTCPLCKARFFKIDRVNKPKKRKAGEGGIGEGGESIRSSKRVRNRDQRTDIPSFINPLEGIFASMEANGTWPTHIAQLLFSGLGASSLGPGGPGRARSATAPRGRSAASSIFPAISDTSAFAVAAAARRQQQQQRHHPASMMGFRYQSPAAGGSSSRTAPSSTVGGSSSLMGQAARASGQGLQRHGGTFSSTSVGGHEGAPLPPSPSPLGANHFAPAPTHTHARPCPRRRTGTRMSSSVTSGANNPHYVSSPWSAGPSVGVGLGHRGFGRRSSTASSTSTSSFQPFPNPGGSGGSRMVASSANGVTADSSPFLSGEEEEELLSTLSPSSYIRRLHRELEGGGGAAPRRDRTSPGQYQFNAFPALSSGRTASARRNAGRAAAPRAAPSPSDNPFVILSAPPVPASPFHGSGRSQRQRNEWNGHTIRSGSGNNLVAAGNAVVGGRGAAGRSLETALEIESDDDDDVVEVIDVEALI